MKKFGIYTFIAALLFVVSCSDDAEDNIAIEGGLTQTEVRTILETDEATSAVDQLLSEFYFQNGNTSKSTDDDCYTVEYTDNGFVATFNNCVLNDTENVNGTLNVTYNVDDTTASYTATFADFYIGAIKVNGTRSFSLTGSEEDNSLSFTIISDITLELEDGSIIAENGNKTFALVFEEGEDTLWNLSGTWTIEKDGDTYIISGNVSKNFICEYWTQGTMTVNKNGLAVDVDFGDGTCDNKATLIYPNGATEEITL